MVLAGPTATGKTALSLAAASAFDAEIVSADSRQVYRGFDIGTAKVSKDEQRLAPHHLIDVADPTEVFDVGRFVDLARAAIADIHGRRRLALVVGGTGLYLRALCGGLVATVGRDDRVRQRLQHEAQALGREALHERLAVVDPVAAGRISPQDLVRVVRALEVHEVCGQPLSALQHQHSFADRPFRVLWLVVDRQRQELGERIAQRCKAMFAGGLVEEAVALRARYGGIDLLGTLGYAEALDLYDGRCDQEAALTRTAARTRRYAKRQRTWLRKEPIDAWLLAPRAAQVVDAIKAWLDGDDRRARIEAPEQGAAHEPG